jgi:hypothetical protein
VGVIHGEAVLADDVGEDRLVGDAALLVVPVIAVRGLITDRVLRVEEVTVGEAAPIVTTGLAGD